MKIWVCYADGEIIGAYTDAESAYKVLIEGIKTNSYLVNTGYADLSIARLAKSYNESEGVDSFSDEGDYWATMTELYT